MTRGVVSAAALSAILGLAACSSSSSRPTAGTPPVSTSTTQPRRPITRPFNGSGSAQLLRTGASTFALDGTIAVAGLGRCKYHETGTFIALEQWRAVATITAPNADTVKISSVGGVLNPTGVSARDKLVETRESVTGGTGQFLEAHGTTSTTGETVISQQGVQTFTFKFTGSITTKI